VKINGGRTYAYSGGKNAHGEKPKKKKRERVNAAKPLEDGETQTKAAADG